MILLILMFLIKADDSFTQVVIQGGQTIRTESSQYEQCRENETRHIANVLDGNKLVPLVECCNYSMLNKPLRRDGMATLEYIKPCREMKKNE